jgi:pathogenesis-related protein 1
VRLAYYDVRVHRLLTCLALALLTSCGAAAERSAAATTTSAGREDPPEQTREDTPTETAPTSDPRMAAIVEAHTARRAQHCAAPLAWSETLAQQAQSWADHLAASGCQLEHSQSPYGENLAAGTEGTLSPEDVVDMWYREVSAYRFRSGGFSMDTGHFTQLVWASSQHLGCGVTTCGGLDVWVCNYDPPGNVEGQYRENVLPTSCR